MHGPCLEPVPDGKKGSWGSEPSYPLERASLPPVELLGLCFLPPLPLLLKSVLAFPLPSLKSHMASKNR